MKEYKFEHVIELPVEGEFQEDYPAQIHEFRRQQIVRGCEDAVSRISGDLCDGSVEERDYIDAALARAFVKRVVGQVATRMLKADLEKRSKANAVRPGKLEG